MGYNSKFITIWSERYIMADKTLEFSADEISTFGLILIAIVSLIHTTILSLYVVIPIISILILGLLIKQIKNIKK